MATRLDFPPRQSYGKRHRTRRNEPGAPLETIYSQPTTPATSQSDNDDESPYHGRSQAKYVRRRATDPSYSRSTSQHTHDDTFLSESTSSRDDDYDQPSKRTPIQKLATSKISPKSKYASPQSARSTRSARPSTSHSLRTRRSYTSGYEHSPVKIKLSPTTYNLLCEYDKQSRGIVSRPIRPKSSSVRLSTRSQNFTDRKSQTEKIPSRRATLKDSNSEKKRFTKSDGSRPSKTDQEIKSKPKSSKKIQTPKKETTDIYDSEDPNQTPTRTRSFEPPTDVNHQTNRSTEEATPTALSTTAHNSNENPSQARTTDSDDRQLNHTEIRTPTSIRSTHSRHSSRSHRSNPSSSPKKQAPIPNSHLFGKNSKSFTSQQHSDQTESESDPELPESLGTSFESEDIRLAKGSQSFHVILKLDKEQRLFFLTFRSNFNREHAYEGTITFFRETILEQTSQSAKSKKSTRKYSFEIILQAYKYSSQTINQKGGQPPSPKMNRPLVLNPNDHSSQFLFSFARSRFSLITPQGDSLELLPSS